MSQRNKLSLFVLILSLIAWGNLLPTTQAQTPRPTPTIDPFTTPTPTATAVPSTNQSAASGGHGSIQGRVYQDVNGDGVCVESGVDGEEPVPNIDVEFISSDEQTVITLYTGPDGRYGLAAAGFSYWSVTAKPGPEWSTTSEKTLHVPIYEDSRSATGIDFCIEPVQTVTTFLPASGRDVSRSANLLKLSFVAGLTLVAVGFGLYWRQSKKTS
jgi:hypothetical protein